MRRVLAITKRVDLSDIAEGWDGAYALVTGASYEEFNEMRADVRIADLQKANKEEQADAGFNFITYGKDLAKKHFVRGVVKVLDEEGALIESPMEPGDIDDSIDIANRLIAAVTGVTLDPKASSTPTPATSSTQTDSSAQ